MWGDSRLVGTRPDAFASGRFAHPTRLRGCRLRQADASEAREFYRRAAEVEAEYRAEKIDLKALDPAGGDPEIAVQRQANAGARRGQPDPSVVVGKVLA